MTLNSLVRVYVGLLGLGRHSERIEGSQSSEHGQSTRLCLGPVELRSASECANATVDLQA